MTSVDFDAYIRDVRAGRIFFWEGGIGRYTSNVMNRSEFDAYIKDVRAGRIFFWEGGRYREVYE